MSYKGKTLISYKGCSTVVVFFCSFGVWDVSAAMPRTAERRGVCMKHEAKRECSVWKAHTDTLISAFDTLQPPPSPPMHPQMLPREPQPFTYLWGQLLEDMKTCTFHFRPESPENPQYPTIPPHPPPMTPCQGPNTTNVNNTINYSHPCQTTNTQGEPRRK